MLGCARGLLVQEREALLIEALWVLGERDDARERAAAFLRRYPSSPTFAPSSACMIECGNA